MKFLFQKPKGMVAMVSMLIVASIATFVALNMLSDGLENATLSIDSVNYEGARLNSITCLEDTLLRIKQNDQFTQNLNYTLSSGNTCSTTISWQNEVPMSPGITEQQATLEVAGVSQGFTRTFQYELKIRKFDVNDTDGTLNYLKNIDFISIEEI